MFSHQITLRKVSLTQDSYGGAVESYTDRTVWANRKSATRSEFYNATMAGHQISDVFDVHVEDYDGETYVTFESTRYKVARTYRKGDGTIELNCEVVEVLNTLTFAVTSGGNPVEGASVTLDGVTKTTSALGGAVFYSVPNGVNSYTVTKTGLTTVSSSVTVTGDATVSVVMVGG